MPAVEIIGEGISLGLLFERCNSQELDICARPGGIFRYFKVYYFLPVPISIRQDIEFSFSNWIS